MLQSARKSCDLSPKEKWKRFQYDSWPVLKMAVFEMTLKCMLTFFGFIIHNCYQHCFVKLLPLLSFFISGQNCFYIIVLCLLGLTLNLSFSRMSPFVKCSLGSFRSDQQSRAVATLSISVFLKERTVYSFGMFCFVLFFGEDSRKTERSI